MFSSRILTVDSYQEIPVKGYDDLYSDFRSSEIYKVPIIRIYGKTSAGQSTCLHVHGVYPYLMLRWKDVFPGIDIKDSHKFLQELALEIDKALHVASRKSGSSHHHVFKITVEKKFCFYGYHRNEENFLKVYFYEPRDVSRSSELLANGAIRNKSIQPHQAHFPFIFQFMVDFNLSGMDNINVSQYQFRASISKPSPGEIENSSSLYDGSSPSVNKLWNIDSLHSSQVHSLPRTSRCDLELDCSSSSILNKSEAAGSSGTNPALSAIWLEERMRTRSSITPSPSQEREAVFETESELQYKNSLHDFLKRYKKKCFNQDSEEADTLFGSGSQNLLLQSSGSINLSTSQDMQVLGDLLSMANNNDPENDSILGFVIESDSEEETIAMSQRFTAEPWTPQIMGSQEDDPSSVSQKFPEISSPLLIPQFDGTYDDDEEESYEQFGPMLFKEEKELCTANTSSNAIVEFDDEPPVLQPEQPLEIQNISYFKSNQIIECSVKIKNHPILKNIDPSKPILLTSLEKNFSSFEKSTSSSIKHNSDVKVSKSQQKACKKSQKFDHTIQKCLSSVISKVEKELDRESHSGSIQTTKTALKYSEVYTTKVTTISTTECLKSEQQGASEKKFSNISTVESCSKGKKSVSSKNCEMDSVCNKTFSQHTHNQPKKDVFKSSCDKVKSNNNCIASAKIKNDSSALPTHPKSLFTETKKSKLPSHKRTDKSSLVIEKVSHNIKQNNLSVQTQNVFSDIASNQTKKNKLSKHKSKSSSESLKKEGVDVCKVNDPELKTVGSAYKMENKTISNDCLIPNNFEVKNFQSLDLKKLGTELVVVRKMTESEIDNYTKISSPSVSGQTYRASKECLSNSERLQKTDQSNHRKKHANAVSDATVNNPAAEKLTSERKIAKVSKKFKNPKSSFNNDFLKARLESQPLNNKTSFTNKHSSLSLFNNDDSDFKNSFNSFSPNKHSLETSLNEHNKKKKMNKFSSKRKEKNLKISSNLSKKSFPCLEVSAKPFEEAKKKVIEEQVKFSLEENNELPEVSIISEHPTSSLKILPVIDLTSDEEDVSLQQKKVQNEAMIPEEYKNCIQRSLRVNLYDCSDLIKKYCADQFSEHIRRHIKKETPKDSKVKVPKVQLKSEPKYCSSLQNVNQEPVQPKIKYEKTEIPQVIVPSEIYNPHLKSTNADNSKLLYAVKSEPVAINEIHKTKQKPNFHSTIDANLLSSNALAYAVKSKPVVKCGLNSVVTSNVPLGSDIGIYAVKSKPSVKTTTKTLTCEATPSKKDINSSNLPFTKCPSNFKLQTNNKSILKSDSCRTNNKVQNLDSDFKIEAPTPKNALPSSKKTKLSPKNGKDLKVVLDVGKTSDTIKNVVKNGYTSKSKMPEKKKPGFDFKSPIVKNPGSVPKKDGVRIKKNVTYKSGREFETVKEKVSNESSHILSAKVTGPTAKLEAFGSKSEITKLDQDSSNNTDEYVLKPPGENPSSMKKKSPKSLDKKSKSLDLPIPNSISPNDKKVANPEAAIDVSTLNSSSSSKTPLATPLSNAATKFQNHLLNNSTKDKILTDCSASIVEELNPLPIVENDLYDIVKRRTANKTNCITKVNRVSNDEKMLNNNFVDKLLLNSKSSKSVKKSVTISKDDLLPFSEKTVDHSIRTELVTNKKLTEKLAANKSNCSKTNKETNVDDMLDNDCAVKLLTNSKSSKHAKNSITSSKEELSSFHEETNDHSSSTESVTGKKATEKLSNKINCISKAIKETNSHKILDSSCVDKHSTNSKSSRSVRKNVTSSGDANSPFLKKNDNQNTSPELGTDKKTIVKPKCNSEVECKLPSMDKPLDTSNKETLPHSSEGNVIQTRNNSSHKDFAPVNGVLNNHANTKYPETSISTKLLGSQTANIEAPISPLSLVPRGRKGANSNNFNFFSRSSKKRRDSPEMSMASKPLSSKLSLKLNKTKIIATAKVKTTSPMPTSTRSNKKTDNELLVENPQALITLNPSKVSCPENIALKKEHFGDDSIPGQSSDMKVALSRFDFDENASSEPASCFAYSSNRFLKNKPKALAAPTASKDRKQKKSSQKQRKHSSTRRRKSAKKSTELNILSHDDRVSETSETGSPSIPVVQKLKILKSSSGHIIVPNGENESPSGCSAQSSEKSPRVEQEKNSSSESEDKTKEKGSPLVKRLRIKRICSTSEESTEQQFECILISDSDSSKEETEPSKVSRKKKKRREITPQLSPSEPISLPVPVQNIKKEKEDEKNPIKINLCRKKDNEFYVRNRISCSENVSNINPIVSPLENEIVVPKRGRGRPRKNCKDVSPIKSETSVPVPKKSAVLSSLEVDKLNSFKPLGRKTRSNSARASTNCDYSNVKIKQEPVSEEECAIPSTAIPELQTSIRTRRKSLQCESFKKFFESRSDSDCMERKIIKPKSIKKRSRRERSKGSSSANLSQEVSNHKASCSTESQPHAVNKKSPTKKKKIEDNPPVNAPRITTKRRASATNSYTKYYDSDSDDDIQILRIVSPPRQKRPTRQSQQSFSAKKSTIENSMAAQDSSRDKNYNCQVVMQRLLPSEIEKHCSDPHTTSSISDIATSSTSHRSATPIGNAPIKLIPDVYHGGLRKFASSINASDEVFQNNSCVQFTIPSANIDAIAQSGNLMSKPHSQVKSLATLSSPKNLITEDTRPETNQCSTSSSTTHKDSTTPFDKDWDSPYSGVKVIPPKGDLSLSDTLNSSLEPSHLTNSKRCPKIFAAVSKQVDIDSACSSVKETSTVQSGVTESSTIPKNCDGKLFNKIPDKMHDCVGMSNMFCQSNQNICYQGEDLLSLETRRFTTPQKVNLSNNKTTGEVGQIIKPLQKDYDRTQRNQTVSCFEGYDLQSEASIASPSFVQKESITNNMLDVPIQDNSNYSFPSDNYNSHMDIRKPNSVCNPQSNNTHVNSFNNNFFNSYNTSGTHEDFTNMQLNTNPFSSNSYLEANRSQPNFSIGQSKYSNSFSDTKSNMHTDVFNEWDDFNKSFCPISSFQEKDIPSSISQQKKLDDQFAVGKNSNANFFNGSQFCDTNSVHMPDYFAPDESRKIWSPTEQIKCDSAFDSRTKLASSIAHIELSSIANSFMNQNHFLNNSPSNESLQGSQLSEHLSSVEENDFVGSLGTNSPSYASNSPPSKLKGDEAIDSASATLSVILAGSPLDTETDALKCDAFTPSIEKTISKMEPIIETQSYLNNDNKSSIGDDDKSVNKCDKPELSQMTPTTFQSLDFSDFTDDTEMDSNLFGVYTNAPTQEQSYCEPTFEKALKNNVEHCATSEIKHDNLLLTGTFPSTKSSSTIVTSASYKVPFDNNIPLVTHSTPPSNEHFTPSFSSANQNFISTLLVGESEMVPRSNIFVNGTSIITSTNSPSCGYVDFLPNSEPVVIKSGSNVSNSKNSEESNCLKQPFKHGEDMLSMIVKVCAIGEEYDENLDSPVDNNSAYNDTKIDSFYEDNTLYDLNQTNTETYCPTLQNLNGTCKELSSPISESKESCMNNVNNNSSHHSDFVSSHLSVGSDDPASKKQLPAYCDKTNSSNNYEAYPKTKRKRNSEAFNNGCKKPENLGSSDGFRSKSKEMNDCNSSKPNCDSQLNSRLGFSNNLANSNFLSGDNLESTPSTNRHESRNFLSEELGVSPINKDNLLTSDNKRKRPIEDTPVRSKKLFKCPEKDTAEGPLSLFLWGRLSDQYKDFDMNLSKSDLDGPTLDNSMGFKLNADEMGDTRVRHEVQHLTVMSLELHVNTRSDLNPDPRFDSVAAIFYSIYKDVGSLHQESVGIIAVDNSYLKTNSFHGTHSSLKNFLSLSSCVEKSEVCCVKDEHDLFQKLVSLVRERDPDILVGYEIQKASWGYLIERAGILNMNLASKLSRLVNVNESKFQKAEEDPSVTDQTADLDRINIPGRIVLNLWRLLRKEVNLNIYSFENVYFHLLHKRTPSYTFQDLTNWFKTGVGREAVVRYYATRVIGCIQFLDKTDIIRRTSELARLFGIQFYEVLSRGSQFRVESMMLRSAAPMRYVPVTPSIQQRSRMKAPESVPLILEPESKYYKDPVLVLDFQSLYPSMIIAYNYCFSTCLGRVEHLGKEGSFDFGCTSLDISPEELHKLAEADNIHFSPNGVAFVKPKVRRGVLPTMLKEILDTRVMVKKAMKKIRGNPALKKLLDARQLGLKLISNVTYGYTAASFSGRMPCVEVADSIVAKGRETLERAIRMIEDNPVWNARAVYGDTDSIFVLLSGRTVEEAFKIGQEIVDAVNAANPKPVKLKLEKVYHRCVLQSKKRYVGFMYETVDQEKPIFDAKGIETVRRDSCPATAKILEKSLKTLFRTDNVNLVQKYVQKQFRKLLAGRVNMIDLIFAKEYRGMAGYRPTACVPALELTKKRLAKDPRSEPRSGERVPYVVVYGFPGMPIIKLVHEPVDLLKDPNLRINVTYYITRVISPPLDRVFSLLGHDVKTWYNNLDHSTKLNLPVLYQPGHQRETITQYFVTRNCPSCNENTTSPVCETCRRDPQGTVVTLQDKVRKWERAESNLKKICTSCTKSSSSVDSCSSFDCPILFKLNLAKRDCFQIPYLKKVLAQELF